MYSGHMINNTQIASVDIESHDHKMETWKMKTVGQVQIPVKTICVYSTIIPLGKKSNSAPPCT